MAEQYDENLLLDYVEGELDAKGRAQVERWIAADPRLARLLAQLADDRQRLRQMSDPPAPEWLMDEVDRQLERAMLVDEVGGATSAQVIRKQHVLRRWLVAGSIAAMFAAVSGVVIYSIVTTPTQTRHELAMREEFPSHANEMKTKDQVALNDREALSMRRSDKDSDRAAEVAGPKLSGTLSNDASIAGVDSLAKSQAPAVGEKSLMPASALSSIADAPVAPPMPAARPAPATVASATGEAARGAGASAARESLTAALPSPAEIQRGLHRLKETADADAIVKQLRDQPSNAADFELRIVTSDPAATRQIVGALNTVMNAPAGAVPPSTRMKIAAGAAPADQPVGAVADAADKASEPASLTLRVPLDRLMTAVESLQSDEANRSVSLVARGSRAGDTASAAGASSAGAIWPAMMADYRAILEGQVRFDEPPAQPTSGGGDVVVIPVILQVSDEAKAKPDADANRPVTLPGAAPPPRQ